MTTLREAVANLIKVKGRHNTEVAYQRLIEAYDAALTQPEQERDRGGACVVVNGTSGVFTIPLPGKPGGGGISPAQSEQEPVAQVQVAEDYYPHVVFLDGVDTTSLDQKFLYAAPLQREPILCGCGDQIMPDDGAECWTCVTARNATQREWQGLTDAIVQTLIETAIEGYASNRDSMRWLCRAIEAKLREKNA